MGINIFINIFVSLNKDTWTRGVEVTLVKDQCTLDITKYSKRERACVRACVRVPLQCSYPRDLLDRSVVICV